MNSSIASQGLTPNATIPPPFLSPSQGESLQLSTGVYFATLGALLWDWLMSMPDEYRILSKGVFSTSKVKRRVFTVAFCVSSTMFQVASVSDCQALALAASILTVLALNANNLLFLWRVLANLGSTLRCIEDSFRSWVALAMLANAINDTLVFLAISYRIASRSTGGQGWRSMLRCFVHGDGVPRVWKELLRNGQLCYFATIVLSIAQIIVATTTEYKATFSIPVIALENVMTCRVHRAVVLGLKEQAKSTFLLTTVITNTMTGSDSIMKEFNPSSHEAIEGRIGHVELGALRV
ncbi:hypothetical protein HWV62_41040 [Athelia sp. TMB]|nr:hypothetical protein HWV62_41040 [Athelia sp. TMB]